MAEVCTPWSPSHEDCVNNDHPIVIRVDDHVDCESSNITYAVCFSERMGHFPK